MNLILNKLLKFQITLILIFSIKISWSRIIDESIFKKRNTFNNNNIIVEHQPNEQLKDYNSTIISKFTLVKYMDDEEKNKLKDDLEDYVDISALVTSADFSFYNQLDDVEKHIYNIVYSESAKDIPSFKISVKVSNIDDMKQFTNDLSLISLKVFAVLAYENPELWWIGSCIFSGYQDDYTSFVVIYLMNSSVGESPFASLTAEEMSDLNKEIDQVKNKVMNQIAQTGLTTSYAILRFIHDYLVTRIVYTLDESRKHIRNVYGALVEEKCVCEGYAEAFQYIALSITLIVL